MKTESSPVTEAMTRPARPAGWLCAVASVLIAGHLVAVSAMVLSAQSGPWPTPEGASWATPPHFAQALYEPTEPYLNALKFTHNYHFVTNRPAAACRFEVTLRDDAGKEIAKLQFPDPNAPAGVRFRQELLASGLAQDVSVEPIPGEYVAPPDQPVRAVRYWEAPLGEVGKLTTVAEHLIPRDRPVFGPSEWSMLLAKSYARHLCREHGAASAEILRTTREAIPPDVLFMDSPPPASAFEPLVMNFGVFDAPAND